MIVYKKLYEKVMIGTEKQIKYANDLIKIGLENIKNIRNSYSSMDEEDLLKIESLKSVFENAIDAKSICDMSHTIKKIGKWSGLHPAFSIRFDYSALLKKIK